MVKYLLFAGCNYYPEAGFGDLREIFSCPDLAKKAFQDTELSKPGEYRGLPDWKILYKVDEDNTYTEISYE